MTRGRVLLRALARAGWRQRCRRACVLPLALIGALLGYATPSFADPQPGKASSTPVLVGVPTQSSRHAKNLDASDAVVPGFEEYSLPANDDGSTGEVALPFSIKFFKKTYNGVYINNNGNLTLGAPLSQYTSQPLASIPEPMIAPFWADVDTRVGNVVTYGTGEVDGHAAFGVTWPEVGCYSLIDSTTDTFQVILVSRADVGPGDFDIEFNYGPINWESGEASGGDGECLGGEPARAGYASGTGLSYELPGSGFNGDLLSTDAATGLSHQSYGTSVAGTDDYPVRGGSPVPGAAKTKQPSHKYCAARTGPQEIGSTEVKFKPCMRVTDAFNGNSATPVSIEPPPNMTKPGGCPSYVAHLASSLACEVTGQGSYANGSGVTDYVNMTLNWDESVDAVYVLVTELETDTMTLAVTTTPTGQRTGSSTVTFVSKEIIETDAASRHANNTNSRR